VATTPGAHARSAEPEDCRPNASSHSAPRNQLITKVIAGQVCLAPSSALAARLSLLPNKISPMSIVKAVMSVIITAVAGVALIEIRASSFCTTIAETPSIPAKIKLEKQYGLQE
jgi:hypothetical protein